MVSLTLIPPELVLSVAHELDAPDLFTLSHTCAILRRIISQRDVWRESLRRTCQMFGLFEPSYRMDDIDVSTLRRKALDPWLNCQRITEAGSQETTGEKATFTQQVVLRCGMEGSEREDFVRVQIAPGGRYVVGLTRAYLCLWDLGDGPGHATPVLLCTEAYKPFTLDRYSQGLEGLSQPMLYRRAFLRFLVLGIDAESKAHFLVYEIGPLPTSWDIRLLASLNTGAPSEAVRSYWMFDEDKAVVEQGVPGEVIIWDFSQSLLVSWSTDSPIAETSFVVGDRLVSLEPYRVLVWKIPPLPTFPKTSTFVQCPNTMEISAEVIHRWHPGLTGGEPENVFERNTLLNLSSRWHPDVKEPVLVNAVAFSSRPGTFTLERHAFQLCIGSNSSRSSVKVSLVSSGSITLGSLPSRRQHPLPIGLTLRPLSNGLFSLVHYAWRGSQWAHIALCGDAGSGQMKSRKGLYAFYDGPIMASSHVCLASGSFAYVCTDHRHLDDDPQVARIDGNRVHVGLLW